MGPYPEASWIPQKDGCREPALESLPPKARVPNKSHSRNTAPHFQVVTNPKLKKQTLFLFPNSSILGPSPSLPFTLRSAGQNQWTNGWLTLSRCSLSSSSSSMYPWPTCWFTQETHLLPSLHVPSLPSSTPNTSIYRNTCIVSSVPCGLTVTTTVHNENYHLTYELGHSMIASPWNARVFNHR